MESKKMKVSEILPNPNNPRVIRDDKFKALVRSIEEFPEMLELRTIVVNKDHVVIGGNQRLAACKSLGMDEVNVIVADLTEEEERQFVIKDNVNYGEWDWEKLANEWENKELNLWGMDVWVANHDDEFAPDIDPYQDKTQVTGEDIEKAESEIGSEMRKGRERNLMACQCPKCNTKFNVEK